MEQVPAALTARLVDQLYHEAMDLAEETRSYFDSMGQEERRLLAPMARVVFSCESLKITTRLMHAISWLLVQKAVAAGEMTPEDANRSDRRLGLANSGVPIGQDERLAMLPEAARALVARSEDLFERACRLEQQVGQPEADVDSPARALISRLEAAF
ncbi:DUF1465 family protein [Hankyongella ginsenosidimutans]|uniref:DUF1465 family protein n=1 Tax=Hankyongella ginsenosidimutans TaxID=1763828 RepID=A0A4D7C781_9SPHN|nr:DUF1465 family protein [Hankyongella ginsenosidimutans]QCI79775.1 DUF1465 family protein [Hankyongella ginsenosidimutans]TXG83703.1 MAG: DUF1465 family protein [Sphingomonadales bacterium]